MGRCVNKTQLMGYVGRDPEIKYSQSGMAVANLSLATTENFQKNGEWVEHTEWHSVVAFGKQAEAIDKYVKKGTRLYIEGKNQTSKWQDKDTGKDRYKTEVLGLMVEVLSGGKEDEGSNRSAQPANTSRPIPNRDRPAEFDDDIPF